MDEWCAVLYLCSCLCSCKLFDMECMSGDHSAVLCMAVVSVVQEAISKAPQPRTLVSCDCELEGWPLTRSEYPMFFNCRIAG